MRHCNFSEGGIHYRKVCIAIFEEDWGMKKWLVLSLLCACGVLGAAEVSYSVNVSVLNVRSAPNTTSEVLARMRRGQIVQVLATSGDWHEIKPPEGIEKRCYIAKSMVVAVPAPKKVDNKSGPEKEDAPLNAADVLKRMNAKLVKESVTVRGRLFQLGKDDALPGISFAILKTVEDKYVIDCFVAGEGAAFAKMIDKDVVLVGESYEAPDWKKPIVRVKSLKIQEAK